MIINHLYFLDFGCFLPPLLVVVGVVGVVVTCDKIKTLQPVNVMNALQLMTWG